MEFDEFVTLAAKFIVEEDDEAMQKELREAFRLYDKEGNGYIPTSCLKEILRELDDQLTNEELDMMIDEIDSDGSGTVDFDGEYHMHVHFKIYLFVYLQVDYNIVTSNNIEIYLKTFKYMRSIKVRILDTRTYIYIFFLAL